MRISGNRSRDEKDLYVIPVHVDTESEACQTELIINPINDTDMMIYGTTEHAHEVPMVQMEQSFAYNNYFLSGACVYL